MKMKENQRVTNDQTKLLIDCTDEGTCNVTDIVQHCIAHPGNYDHKSKVKGQFVYLTRLALGA